MPEESEAINYIKPLSCPYGLIYDTDSTYGLRDIKLDNPFLTRGYAKRRNGFLLGLRYANVSLAHSGVESS